MRKFLAFSLVLIGLTSTAQAQAVNVTYPETDLTAGYVLNDTIFPNVDSYFTNADFAPYCNSVLAWMGGGPPPSPGPGGMYNYGRGGSTFIGPGGTTTLTINQPCLPNGTPIPGTADIIVTIIPSPAVGPIILSTGAVGVLVSPINVNDPANSPAPYALAFPVAYQPIPGGPLATFAWSTTIHVPSHSAIIAVYQGTSMGTISAGVCPGLMTIHTIW